MDGAGLVYWGWLVLGMGVGVRDGWIDWFVGMMYCECCYELYDTGFLWFGEDFVGCEGSWMRIILRGQGEGR